jgi:hypothetical protein
MAAPSYLTDLTDIYIDTDNFTVVGGGRVTAAETDDFIQGNNCWSHDPFSSGIEGGMYDDGTAPGITAGDAVYVWTKCDVAATLATHAAGGIQVIMGTAGTAYDCFYALGSDDYQYGGWKCIPVDPTSTPSTSVGSPGAYDHFGVRWNVPSTGAGKGYPMKIDAMRYGRQIEVTVGDATTPATWARLATYDADSTRQWGICQPNDAGAEVQGVVYWGTATTACHFDDSSGETIVLIDTEWTSTDFTKIIIDHASTIFNMDGLTIKALGTNNPGQLIFNNASTASILKNSTFDSIGITTLRAGVTATSDKWKASGTVTLNGATLDSCVFAASTAAIALACGSSITTISDCDFESDGSSHAIEITGGTSHTLDNLKFTGYETYNVNGTSTGNEAVYINIGAGDITLYADTLFSYRTAGANVTIVAGSVNATITAIAVDGSAVDDVSVALYAKDNTSDLPFQESITISNSGTTATVTHTAHNMITNDKVLVQGGDQPYNRGTFSITVTDANTYTYTTSTAPTGNPTGCTATWASIYEALSGTNTVTKSRTFTSDQPVSGWARKSTTSPFYKTAPVTGIISTTLGVNLTALMLSDE